MKKKYFLIPSLALAIFSTQTAFTNSGGAPAGSNGSPLSSSSCSRSGCHSGGPARTNESINISTNIPSSGFQADSVYTITVTANNGGNGSNRIGFMASVEDAAGHAGTLQSTDGRTRITGSYITQTSSGVSGSNGENSWTFDWDAGQAADQSTIYVMANFSNGNGSTSGDVIYSESLTLSKDQGGLSQAETKLPTWSLYPNPVQTFTQLSLPNTQIDALMIYDLKGALLQRYPLHENGSEQLLDLSALESGNYLIGHPEIGFQHLVKE